jgi:hypothetical protein
VIAAVLGYLHLTRPEPPPEPAPPYPSPVVDITYDGKTSPPPGAPRGAFTFAVTLSVSSGPPVSVQSITQPSSALSLTAVPRPPFRTQAGHSRRLVLTIHVRECGKAPRKARLPFISVTLRNTRAIAEHSFILGEHYAEDLSSAMEATCIKGKTS